MEALVVILAWPFLIFAVGMVFFAFQDFAWGPNISPLLLVAGAIILVVLFVKALKGKEGAGADANSLDRLARTLIAFSIAALLPLFVRYMVLATDQSLPVILFGLAFGFGLAIFGMFLKQHRVLVLANVAGGALTLAYVYSQLWNLGEGARIVAAAAGLVIAVVISVIKFRGKLIRAS